MDKCEKTVLTMIREITWEFGAQGLNGECCGDLSVPESRALRKLSESELNTVQTVGSILGFTQSGATRVVNRLVQKGYVTKEKSSVDGRSCCVVVTDKGINMLQNIQTDALSRIRNILNTMEPPVRKMVSSALEIFVSHMLNQINASSEEKYFQNTE